MRGTKTDPIDLVAIADLLLAGRGYEFVMGDEPRVELTPWVAHRRRRVEARSAVKHQLTGQLDRCFPGLGAALSSVPDTKVGRLVAVAFADPDRLVKLGASRFRAFAARRGVPVSVTMAERLVAAARDALSTPDAAVARQVLAADLELLERLDAQLVEVDRRACARHRLRGADQWAGLAAGPCGRLRRRGRRPGTLALPPAGVPGRRAQPAPVRVGRTTS